MKKNIVIILYSCIFLHYITLSGVNDPFDAAIRQIDSQSKELNQNVIHSQQDGLANQKIQRLELELTTIKTDHAQEIAALKASHEEQIKALKYEIAQAQKIHSTCPATIKKLKKELEDMRQELAQLKAKQYEMSATLSPITSHEKEVAEPSSAKTKAIEPDSEQISESFSTEQA